MPGVADHHDHATLVSHPRDLDMHLGDERARGVEHGEAARIGVGAHRPRDAMRREHDGASRRDLGELLDEDRALRLEVGDDELVVDDLVAHVDRRAELRERLFDDGDRAVDARAEAARIREQHVHQFPPPDGTRASGSTARRWRKLSRMRSAAPTEIALSATLKAGHDQP